MDRLTILFTSNHFLFCKSSTMVRSSLIALGAASYVAAQNCNPTYNVASSGACMEKCAMVSS
jgi:hypothetical protein